MISKALFVAAFSLAFFVIAGAVPKATLAGDIHKTVPQAIDPGSRYLFYLHGSWIEKRGLKEEHPHYGAYRYDEILKALADRGFEVISETRFKEVQPQDYANGVAEQIQRLLSLGVPASRVSVVGHSKGGYMAMMVAAILGNDAINYVVMAGCGQKNTEYRSGYEKFIKNRASKMKGRMLSLYDEIDRTAGTCDEAFSLARLKEKKETVLTVGRGHGLFYAPSSEWLDAVVDWGWRD